MGRFFKTLGDYEELSCTNEEELISVSTDQVDNRMIFVEKYITRVISLRKYADLGFFR